MNKQLAVTLAVIQLAGCVALPDYAGMDVEHISHPLAGPPFGPTSDEDSLNHIRGFVGWRHGRAFCEVSLGYKLTDGGFYGPRMTANANVGLMLFGERR